VSDGASYIPSAFAETVNEKAFQITCWWHKQQNVKRKNGKEYRITRIMQAMVYARTFKELEEKFKKLSDEIENSKLDKKKYITGWWKIFKPEKSRP